VLGYHISSYKRNEAVPHLEVLPVGDEASVWEIWMSVLNK
jgi:hypothetical protein